MTRRPLDLVSANIVTIDGNAGDTFYVEMRSQVKEVRLRNIWPGHLYVFLFSQDSVGRHSFAWPPRSNGMTIDPAPNSTSVQCFIGNTGNTLEANLPGTWLEAQP